MKYTPVNAETTLHPGHFQEWLLAQAFIGQQHQQKLKNWFVAPKSANTFPTVPTPPSHKINFIPLLAFRLLGLDMVGPLTKVSTGFEYMFVAIDKFSKWFKAFPMVKYNYTTQRKLRNSSKISPFASGLCTTSLIWVPHARGLVSRIVVRIAGSNYAMFSFAHPKANGQVESTNGMIIDDPPNSHKKTF